MSIITMEMCDQGTGKGGVQHSRFYCNSLTVEGVKIQSSLQRKSSKISKQNVMVRIS